MRCQVAPFYSRLQVTAAASSRGPGRPGRATSHPTSCPILDQTPSPHPQPPPPVALHPHTPHTRLWIVPPSPPPTRACYTPPSLRLQDPPPDPLYPWLASSVLYDHIHVMPLLPGLSLNPLQYFLLLSSLALTLRGGGPCHTTCHVSGGWGGGRDHSSWRGWLLCYLDRLQVILGSRSIFSA